MATKKGKLNVKTATGQDEVHLKTSGEQVLLSDGTTVQEFVDSAAVGGTGKSKMQIVADITARDALTLERGEQVLVIDATGDTTVKSGAATYIFDGADYIKLSEHESMDVVFSYNDLTDKPDIPGVKVSATEPIGQKDGDLWIETD